MTTIETLLLVLQVFVALTLIGFILIQHGKGADAGAAFGSSGASGTVFGSQGSGNFLTKITTFLAAVFLSNSLALGYFATLREVPESVMDSAPTESAPIDAAQLDAEFEKMLEKANVRDSIEVDVYDGESDVPAIPTEPETSEVPVSPEEVKASLKELLQDTGSEDSISIQADVPLMPEPSVSE